MVNLEHGKQHMIIKRDGSKELYNPEKLFKVTNWATNENESITHTLLNEIDIKISDEMKIQDLYDELIKTAVNKISAITPMYDEIAKKLYLMKIYKETWGLKRTGLYPHFREFLIKGLDHNIYLTDNYLVYDKIADKFIGYIDENFIEELNSLIIPDRDLLFNYKGLNLFFDKYCKVSNKIDRRTDERKETVELPQITYLTAAIHSFLNEINENTKNDNESRSYILDKIKIAYDNLSTHKITYSTPRITYGLAPRAQFASCVLITPDDDTESLNEADASAAIYSKNMGGISMDFSYIRSRGSAIRANGGKSDGPVPFIKRYEQTISSFNQQSKRAGSGIVYFPWWHHDVIDLIMMKDAGGAENLRARNLKYSIKINRILFDRYKSNDYVTLFDPKEVDLNEFHGEEFEQKYLEYENNSKLRTKKIKAKDLLYNMIKVRAETGNLYVFFDDNVNQQNMFNENIHMSNLCSEVVIPSKPSQKVTTKSYINEKNEYEIHTITKNGEIGLCNLSSVNLFEWIKLTDEEKDVLVANLLEGMDNAIESQYYPVKTAEITNKKNRPIGIGITDFGTVLAYNKLKYTDKETLQLTYDLFNDLYYRVYFQSMLLAMKKGPYKEFSKSKWAEGLTPFHLSKFAEENPLDINIHSVEKWDNLGKLIAINGVRFSVHGSLPPSACHPKTESILTSTGPKSFEDFLIQDCKFDKKTIDDLEISEKQSWIKVENVELPTRFGNKKVNAVYYNGKQKTRTMILEDGKRYTFTLNHPVLTKNGWKIVGELTLNDEIIKISNIGNMKIVDLIDNEEYVDTWGIEIDEVNEYCMGNGIVVHNSSGKSTNALESCEPVKDLFYVESGTKNLPTVVKLPQKYYKYYQRCWDVPNKTINELAAIRQIFLDQAQSFNHYYKTVDSAKEILNDIIYAEELGVKTLYYLQTPKSTAEVECSSCSV